ncbi:hypothetical protein [Streptomyces natalensis]
MLAIVPAPLTSQLLSRDAIYALKLRRRASSTSSPDAPTGRG